ncbi:MAG TPA: hypothetical protein VND22_04090 [Actinomycetota bacterium]|nr:hypothetical protein [Actinomycetota bacterium]
MAADLALLESALHGDDRRPRVRLYRWDPPALSVGAHLDVPASVVLGCLDNGIEVIRRPTGGGAVLHDRDLTYSVVAPTEGRSVLETYQAVASALIVGLKALGLEAGTADRGPATPALHCFAAPTGADISVAGRKLCGSAQVVRRGWFLQHGTFPIFDIRQKVASLLGDAADSSAFLREFVPSATFETLALALIEGFATAFGPPAARGLNREEKEHLERILSVEMPAAVADPLASV